MLYRNGESKNKVRWAGRGVYRESNAPRHCTHSYFCLFSFISLEEFLCVCVFFSSVHRCGLWYGGSCRKILLTFSPSFLSSCLFFIFIIRLLGFLLYFFRIFYIFFLFTVFLRRFFSFSSFPSLTPYHFSSLISYPREKGTAMIHGNKGVGGGSEFHQEVELLGKPPLVRRASRLFLLRALLDENKRKRFHNIRPWKKINSEHPLHVYPVEYRKRKSRYKLWPIMSCGERAWNIRCLVVRLWAVHGRKEKQNEAQTEPSCVSCKKKFQCHGQFVIEVSFASGQLVQLNFSSIFN